MTDIIDGASGANRRCAGPCARPALDLRLTCQRAQFTATAFQGQWRTNSVFSVTAADGEGGQIHADALAHRVLWNGGARSWSCDMDYQAAVVQRHWRGAAQLHQCRPEGSLRARQCLAAGNRRCLHC